MHEIRDMEKMAAREHERKPQEYSMGFAFTSDKRNVLLIRKNRPAWQNGLLNGIGGHMEPGETPEECQIREFCEETGVLTSPGDWRHFATMQGSHFADGGAIVHCYEMASDVIFENARTTTDEPIVRQPVAHCHLAPDWYIPNLPILLPLALNRDTFQRPVILTWPATAPRGDGDGFNHTR